MLQRPQLKSQASVQSSQFLLTSFNSYFPVLTLPDMFNNIKFIICACDFKKLLVLPQLQVEESQVFSLGKVALLLRLTM